MNKIQVGTAPSPNIRNVQSKIGASNPKYKPGGGNVKIENKKLDVKGVASRVGAKNESYNGPTGGDKKV